MKILSTITLLFLSFSNIVFAQETETANEQKSDSVVIDPRTAQKELFKNLKEARILSSDVQKPDFTKARKEIDKAINNSQFEENKGDVYYEAGNVEYNCYNVERNKPAKGGKIDYDVLYSSTVKGFQYLNDAYDIFTTPDKNGKVSNKNKGVIQKKAWTLFNVTDGFRANAAHAFEKKDWKTAHDCFDLFVKSVQSKMLTDYASTNYKVKNLLNLYSGDSIIAHAKYFRAISSINSNNTDDAISELEEIKYDGFEQNVVLQELCRLYREIGDDTKLEKTLTEGMKLIPNEPWYSRNLVNIYLEKKEYSVAREMIDNLIKVDSETPANLSLKGQLVELEGDIKEAMNYYERSYALDPKNFEINSHLGRVWYNNANAIEKEFFDKRLYDLAESESLPIYIQAMEYYEKAFKYDENHEEPTIGKAIRTICYKQFSKADCPNREELIDKYNEVSRAYGLTEFPK